jgi:hypothetical protein
MFRFQEILRSLASQGLTREIGDRPWRNIPGVRSDAQIIETNLNCPSRVLGFVAAEHPRPRMTSVTREPENMAQRHCRSAHTRTTHRGPMTAGLGGPTTAEGDGHLGGGRVPCGGRGEAAVPQPQGTFFQRASAGTGRFHVSDRPVSPLEAGREAMTSGLRDHGQPTRLQAGAVAAAAKRPPTPLESGPRPSSRPT